MNNYSVRDGPRICMKCRKNHMICACDNIGVHQDMAYAIPALPSTATPAQRTQRYKDCVMFHPAAGCFDIEMFLSDIEAKGTYQALTAIKPRLVQMMENYLSTPGAEEVRQAVNFTKKAYREECMEAINKLVDRNWSEMATFHLHFINNAFQASDPSEFRLDDPQLKKVFEVVSVLTNILEMCSRNVAYSFEMFD